MSNLEGGDSGKFDKQDTQERIGTPPAATRYKGEIFTGIHHGESYEAFLQAHPELEGMGEEELGLELGFMTSTGRFLLEKKEALEIAHRNDQLKEGVIQRRTELLASDLKPESGLQERIVSAAIKYKGEIFSGKSHYDAWLPMSAKYPETTTISEGRVDGFLTNTERFVSREEALEIAKAADQLERSLSHTDELLAEHLKEEE